MEIRHASEKDIDRINNLLRQVLNVHHNGRPDLFKADAKKYTDEELLALIADEKRPIFVADDGAGNILGYAFCVFQQHIGDNILTDIKTLYIDDLCVDERCRGEHIGRTLYEYVLAFAKQEGCYNVTDWSNKICTIRKDKLLILKIYIYAFQFVKSNHNGIFFLI